MAEIEKLQQNSVAVLKSFQPIGREISFGKGIKVQLCAMPRSISNKGYGIVGYGARGKSTQIPRGERFYPFKLGYIVKIDSFVRIDELYRFVAWQLLFERKVRFLTAFGELGAVKDNSRWVEDHLRPLEKLLEHEKGRDGRRNVADFM